MRNKEFKKILGIVPPDYYQQGVKTNLLQKYWHTTKVSFLINILQKIPFKKCLDVGSASGYMVSQVAIKYPQAQFAAVDAYVQAIRYGQKNYPQISFYLAQAEKLPFSDNQFDLILCYETIEHVRHPQKALLEMKRVLKKRGTLILSMDSGNWLFRIIWWFWEKTYGRVWKDAHLHPYHHTDLEKLVLNSKLNIYQKHFTHFGLEVVYLLKKK